MKKAIFLDVDGVLNNSNFLKETKIKKEDRWILDKEAIAQLKRIVDVSNADIVLSSSWRKVPSLRDKLCEQLAEFGMCLIDDTPYIPNAERGCEIKWWLDNHPEYENYVVLDDDADMTAVMDHFVQTAFFGDGLTEEIADKAIRIINGQ